MIAVVYPFSTTAPLSQKVATAVINLLLGAAIGSLIGPADAKFARNPAESVLMENATSGIVGLC